VRRALKDEEEEEEEAEVRAAAVARETSRPAIPRPAKVGIELLTDEEEEEQKACGYMGSTILTILMAVSSSRVPTEEREIERRC
jgi:hypothetical protein